MPAGSLKDPASRRPDFLAAVSALLMSEILADFPRGHLPTSDCFLLLGQKKVT